MSDVPTGTMSLEENVLPPEPPPPPDPPQETAPPPQHADDTEPDGVVVNPNGEKLVPLSVVAKLREEKRSLNEQIGALKPKAEKVDQIVAEWNNAQPILEQAKRLASQPPPPQNAPPSPKGPLSDTEAEEYARDLQLFKPDGALDLDTAQRIAKRQQAIAEKQAQQYVQPLIQQNAQGQSRANFEQAAAFKADNGIQADRAILQQIWSNVPPEMSAQPHIARVLWSQAVTESLLQGKIKIGNAPAPPPPPVAHTESLGGGHAVKREHDHVERGFMQAAGMKSKDFDEISTRFKPGERNSLE